MRSNLPTRQPFFYIEGSLDLSGMRTGETRYFNVDNSLAYETDPAYTGFLTLNGTCILGDVIVRTEPQLQTPAYVGGLGFPPSPGVLCMIGGARSTSDPVVLPYSAPFGFAAQTPPKFNGSTLSIGQLNQNPISYFGRTAARFPYGVTNNGTPDTLTDYNFLAITVFANSLYPAGTLMIDSGTIHIKLKVYPKTF